MFQEALGKEHKKGNFFDITKTNTVTDSFDCTKSPTNIVMITIIDRLFMILERGVRVGGCHCDSQKLTSHLFDVSKRTSSF